MGIDVHWRDALSLYEDMRFAKAVDAFNENPEKYMEEYGLNQDPSTLSDEVKACIYALTEMRTADPN